MKKKRKPLLKSAGFVAIGLIIGILLGGILFPTTKIIRVDTDTGKYTYDVDYKSWYEDCIDGMKDKQQSVDCYKSLVYSAVHDFYRIRAETCAHVIYPISNSHQQVCHDALNDAYYEYTDEFNNCQYQE